MARKKKTSDMSVKELAKLILKKVEENKNSEEKYRINDLIQLIEWSRVRREPIIMSHIFVVTTMRFGYMYMNPKRSKDGKFHSFYKRTSKNQRKYYTIIRKRTWGWYQKLEEAQKAVEENHCDIYEGEYSYAVIERVSEGVLHGADLPDEWWYKWHGSWERGRFKKWKKPKHYDNIMFFMDRMKQLRAHWGDILEED